MKKTFIIANWKSNITTSEANSWLGSFDVRGLELADKKVIICPSFALLSDIKSYSLKNNSSVKIGAQDISPFGEGSYTGEVNGKQLKDFAEFVIVGHSERRKNFVESNDTVNLKIKKTFEYGLTPIICVSDLEQVKALQEITKTNNNFIIAYEPLFAIGSGTPDTPENADLMAEKIKNIIGDTTVVYGGSVTSDNINNFSKMSNIGGALVGKASLDPAEFLQIIKNA
jgi:triosephosphate isomerase (TIM)